MATARFIMAAALPTIRILFMEVAAIIKDPHLLSLTFLLLQSGRWYKSLRTAPSRFKTNFSHQLLGSWTTLHTPNNNSTSALNHDRLYTTIVTVSALIFALPWSGLLRIAVNLLHIYLLLLYLMFPKAAVMLFSGLHPMRITNKCSWIFNLLNLNNYLILNVFLLH